MNQPMKNCGKKIPYLCKICTTMTYVYTWELPGGKPSLVYPSSTYLLLHTLYAPTSFIISSLKTVQKPPNLIMIKPTQYLSQIKLPYHFWNHIIPQRLFPMPNPFNYRQKYHIGRYACETSHPFSRIWCMTHCWYRNDTPGKIHKEGIISKIFLGNIFQYNNHNKNKLILKKSNTFTKGISQGKHIWNTLEAPHPVTTSLYLKIIQNHKDKSHLWLYSNFPATLLVPRGLKFELT